MATEKVPSNGGQSKMPRAIPTRLPTTEGRSASNQHSLAQSALPKKRTLVSSQNKSVAPEIPTATRKIAKPPSSSAHTQAASRYQRTADIRSQLPNPPAIPRGPIFEPTRTPSLVSGSSSSTTNDSPRSVMLRRKNSFGRSGSRSSPDSGSSKEETRQPVRSDYGHEYSYSDRNYGHQYAQGQYMPQSQALDDGIIVLDGFDRQPTVITHDLPPPTPVYANSATSSSRFSPGVFSISSTPTSMTSYSPAIGTSGPTSFSPLSQMSPVFMRPPSSRKMTDQGSNSQDSTLPGRQSSSSSNSTVKGATAPRKGKISLPSSPRPVVENGVRKPVVQQPSMSRVASPTKSKTSKVTANQPREYPELAHLKDASPMKLTSPVKFPPPRPSRNNTPDMNLTRASPIIQSNMNSLPPYHKRQSSSGSRLSMESKGRPTVSRQNSTRPATPASVEIKEVPILAPTPIRSAKEIEGQSKSRFSPGPEKNEKSQSRFGFFKRNKPEAPSAPAREPRRLRKGPVAGTGHEGYGKFGARGRSSSNTSGSALTGRSSSADSGKQSSSRPNSARSKTTSDLDDFLAERLNPITLRGNGPSIVAQEPPSHKTVQSLQKSEDRSRQNSQTSLTATVSASSSTLASPKIPASADASPGKSSIRTFQSATTVESKSSRLGLSGLSSLSTKRASRRSMMDSQSSIPPEPKAEFRFPSHPAINPLQQKSLQARSAISEDHELLEDEHGLNRSGKKWNFFQRTKTPVKVTNIKASEGMAVAIPNQAPPRAVAHYMMNDSPRKINVQDLEKIMADAENQSDTEIEDDDEPEEVVVVEEPKHGHSILLPAPPSFLPEFASTMRPASPKITLQPTPKELQEAAEQELVIENPSPPLPKGSRLQQVGRIPRVISRRERQRKPSISSFSRPFDVSQPSPALQSVSFGDQQLAGIQQNRGLSTHRESIELEAYRSQVSSPSLMLTSANQSQISLNSIMPMVGNISSVLNFPTRNGPDHEDVWKEYDDLLDSLVPETPKTPRTPPHTGSSLGAPFQYSTFASPQLPSSNWDSQTTPPVIPIPVPSLSSLVHTVRFPSMRESQPLLSAALATPTTPASIGDFLDREPERNSSGTGRFSLPSSSRLSSNPNRLSLPASLRTSLHKRGQPSVSSIPEASPQLPKRKRDSLKIQRKEVQSMGYENMANLRFGALMTSKWLSFGRVLFSPAHGELKNPKEDRVLVLDGLGKDWSYYVALTYQSASVYNLSVDPSDSAEQSETPQNSAFQSLPNHHHIHHPNLGYPFPFPKGFFAAVVFRFPPTASESVYRFAVGECKRVLRPGGHLEVSVLDMDMLNMGNLGRRALRSLKERLHADDPTVCLKSSSDTLQRLIGRRGFENLSRCFVGVPAVGCVPSSKEGSRTSSAAVSPIKESFGSFPSFGDLLRDETSKGDAGITHMVSRVGRWWYSRCYEADVMDNPGVDSIWNDTALVKECEERGTSLRLMVCFAQKPECAVRRTISV